MLIPSDLMVLGTRYCHESGVPSCALLHQRNSFLRKSSIQGLSSTAQQARSSGSGKSFSADGRWEEGNNMQRAVSRHTALKFNQFLAASAQSSRDWRSLGFSRSVGLQPMDSSSVTSLTGNNARVLGSLPGHNGGGGSVRVNNASVPRLRPAVTRRSFRESRNLVTRRSRQRSTSNRLGSTGDFSAQRLLECAVDVLRNFNEKVNNLFQRGGDIGTHDFSTAAEEKVLASADNNAGREIDASELVADDVVFEQEQQQPGSEFEWRSALWEAEISSVEELEAATQRGEADVGLWAGEKIEATLPAAAITASPPQPQSPKNNNVVSTVPVSDTVSSVEVMEETVVSTVEESKLEFQSGHIEQLSGVPESSLGESYIEIQADDYIEEASTGPVAARREMEHPENGNIAVQESGNMSSLATEEPQVLSSVMTESVLSEADIEIRADEKIEEAFEEARTANQELEHLENGIMVSSIQGSDSASSLEIEVAEVSSVEASKAESSRSAPISFSSDGDNSQLSGPDVPASTIHEADVKIGGDDKIEEASAVAITSERELEHPEDVDVVSRVQESDGAVSTEIKEVDIGELWSRNSLGYSSLTGLEPSISRELRPWGSGVVDSEPVVTLDADGDGKAAVLEDPVGQSVVSEPSSILRRQGSSSLADVEAQTVQLSSGEREGDQQIESGDGKSPSEVLAEQNAASEPYFGSSLANAKIETVQTSAPQTQDGLGAKSYRVEQLLERTPDSEPSPTLASQPLSSTGSVDHEVGKCSEGLSLGKDGPKIASLGSTEGGESLSVEGQVVIEESGTFIEKRGQTEKASEEELLQNGARMDALLHDDSSGEAGELSSSGGQTLAGGAGFTEAIPVSPGDELSPDEFGEPFREQGIDDAKVASERQIQADPSTCSDSSADQSTEGMDALRQDISRLRNSIGHHAHLYHTLDSPAISDAAYDSLVKALENLETQVSNSEPPLNLVVAQPSPIMLKIVHSVPMLSLVSVQKEEEALLWYQKLRQKLGLDQETLRWVVEPKVDGLALSLRYENGNLKWAATRGNGIQGEDVTHNAQRVLGIPVTIPQKLHGTQSPLAVLEVRGEIFMSLKDFREWNASKIQSGEKPMASPRNAAAGSMRLLFSNASDVRPLSFMAYNIAVIEVAPESAEENLERFSLVPKSQWEAVQLLKSAGFTVNEDNRLFESFDSALEYAKSWRSTRKSLEYEADGVVLKVDDLATQASLGSSGADPRWALAWKFSATEAVSVLEGIELTIGRSGAMIPNARFQPVELGGVTLCRASLHNFRHVKALGLCEGDHIVVQRAGDVIPQIVQVLEEFRPETAKPWSPPQECPACGSTLTQISASAMVFCSNSTCPSRHSRQVAHFARTLISGLGSANLGRLEEELVKDPADFYDLDEEALANVKGFGKQSAKKLLKAIEESKQQDLWLFIAALGIPRVGANTAKELAEKFGSLQALLDSDLSGFMDVPGIGAATAQCIFDWCQTEANIELVHRLEAAGCKINGDLVIETQGGADSKDDNFTNESEVQADVVGEDIEEVSQTNVSAGEPDLVEDLQEAIETSESGETSDDLKKSDGGLVDVTLRPTAPALSGKSIVITGDFGSIRREDMKKLVTLHGGVVRTSVTSRTSFVLFGNRPGPLKVAEASRRGIEMVDFHDFLRLIGQTQGDIV